MDNCSHFTMYAYLPVPRTPYGKVIGPSERGTYRWPFAFRSDHFPIVVLRQLIHPYLGSLGPIRAEMTGHQQYNGNYGHNDADHCDPCAVGIVEPVDGVRDGRGDGVGVVVDEPQGIIAVLLYLHRSDVTLQFIAVLRDLGDVLSAEVHGEVGGL